MSCLVGWRCWRAVTTKLQTMHGDGNIMHFFNCGTICCNSWSSAAHHHQKVLSFFVSSPMLLFLLLSNANNDAEAAKLRTSVTLNRTEIESTGQFVIISLLSSI